MKTGTEVGVIRIVPIVLAAALVSGISATAIADVGAQSLETFMAATAAYDRGDHSQAAQALLPLAESGDAAAQYLLASATANQGAPLGNEGLPSKQLDDAHGWFDKAARQGLVPAMRDAGHLQLLYRGSPDVALAAKWYEMAARRGDAESQQILGLVRFYGFGQPVDLIEGMTWLLLSAGRSADNEQKKVTLLVIKKLRNELTGAQFREAERKAGEWAPESAEPLDEAVIAKIRAVTNSRERMDAKVEIAAQKYMASLPQLRYGKIVGGILNLDAVFGALLYPRGGLVGKN